MAFSIGLSIFALAVGLTALWAVTEITKKVMGQTKEQLDLQKIEMQRVIKSFDEALVLVRREINILADENVDLRRELRTEWKAQSEELARIKTFVDEFEAAWNRKKKSANER